MQHIATLVDTELRWEQPSILHQRFELHAGDATVATLNFRSAWGSLATAESADGCWTFKRVGFWQTRVTVRHCESEDNLAVYQQNTWTSGGTLTLADQRAFHFTTNTWQNQMDVLDTQEQELLHYNRTGWLTFGATLTIAPRATAVAELPWLTLFGWYVIVMMNQDAATAATVTVAAT